MSAVEAINPQNRPGFAKILDEIGQFVKKYEVKLFYSLLLVNLLPVMLFRYFATNDGGVHLYSARIMDNLLSGNADIFRHFFEFNNELVPNWVGHAMLFLFIKILPGWAAEKLLQIIYLLFLPIVFRRYVQSTTKGFPGLSWLVLLFTYTFNFNSGFYNFSLALIIMFILCTNWVNLERWRLKNALVFFMLLLALYFSHLFVFGFTLICLGIIWMLKLVNENNGAIDSGQKTWARAFQQLMVLILLSSPGLLLTFLHFAHQPAGVYHYLSIGELLEYIRTVRPIVFFGFHLEGKASLPVLVLLLTLTILAIRQVVRQTGSDSVRKINYLKLSGNFLIALVALGMFFYLPDDDGYAGFISIRLITLFFMFLIAGICSYTFSDRITGLVAIVFSFCFVWILAMNIKCHRQINENIKHVIEAAKKIEPNSLVVTVNWTKDWFKMHYPDYASAERSIMLADNYECDTKYFPLSWSEKHLPKVVIEGGQASNDCFKWKSNDQGNTLQTAAYVLEYGRYEVSTQKDCFKQFNDALNAHYTVIYTDEDIRLFRIK